ncbi:hypothetical protein V6S67_19585 [Arthrobacter sp. Soc17.1.1.1]|uniref:hypothetical protein n=1 Tax=Arthrobacter sp. Soc17.1.1.1 TaxID=3121277 RepID=UPI002FE47237
METIADLRFVTSIDKAALLDPSVQTIHPLTAPQRARFSRWVGARYARVPHANELEANVLPKAAKVIQDHAKKFAKGDVGDPATRLVGAVDRWYLDGNDKMVNFIAVASEASLKKASFWLGEDAKADLVGLQAAADKLRGKISASLASDAGYVCKVSIKSLQFVSAAEFLSWSEWIVEKNTDPLS